MIDLHSHVLPGIDDGPASMEAAVALAKAAAIDTTTLVATPHIDHHWGVRPEELPGRLARLLQALTDEGVELDIRTGGEIALTRLPDLSREEVDILRLGDGPYLLIESPLNPSAGDFDMLVMRLRERGESILLAHPERSPLFQREPQRLVRLVEAGFLCSITAGSMRGEFGELVRRFTVELLREGLVHDIASDCHDHVNRRPGLGDAFAQVAQDLPRIAVQAEWLTRHAPAAILAGEPLPPRPT